MTRVRDDSPRARVEAMFQSIAAEAEAETKSEVTKVSIKYQSTFSAEPDSFPKVHVGVPKVSTLCRDRCLVGVACACS